jgi:hypothetical protein
MALTAIIKSKIGSTSEWEKSLRVLNKGEIGIEMTNCDENDKPTEKTSYMIKVGNGKDTFNDLPYANDYTELINRINNISNLATPEDDGIFSKEDKTKLDNIEENANNYIHPVSGVTAGLYNQVRVNKQGHVVEGYNASTLINNANATNSGLMSSADKIKLDKIEDGANNYTLPTAKVNRLGGIKVGVNLTVSSDGVLNAINTTYSMASQNNNGLMSSADKTKLDNIDLDMLESFTLQSATRTRLGGIKVDGSTCAVDSEGILKIIFPVYNDATTSSHGFMSASDKLTLDSISKRLSTNGTVCIGKDKPTSNNDLWIDTGNNGIIKYYDSSTYSWVTVPAVWG